MSEMIEVAKTVTPMVVPLITQLINTWLKPKLEEMRKNNEISKELSDHMFGDKFGEYLARSYEKYSYMNTIVFQNQRKLIDTLYVPLNVSTTDEKGKTITFKLDDYKDEFIPTYKRVLITDTAGMGKSTSVKWLFLSCIKNQKGIPIFVELRRLSKGKGVIDEIYRELNPIDDEINKDFILKLIKRGDFIFFFDGYDEIPLGDREEVTRDLQDFIHKAGENLFVITSRPESALASFGDFQQFGINPLKKNEAYELIRKYDSYSSFSEELVEKLEGEESIKNLHEFLTNPLLVSLLFKAYCYKPIIPAKKHIFYRQVYDALFESHDLTKGNSYVHEKNSRLDIEDFHMILRTLGFLTFKEGKIEFDKDELVSFVKKSKKNCPGLEFKESDFIKDLITTVPLFNKEGNYYKWAHKSIQEYFVAQFIYQDAKDKQEILLKQMYKSEKNRYYINVLDLYYDIDYKTFRKAIIWDVVNEFIKYCETTYTKIDRNKIKESDISFRQNISFCTAFTFVGDDHVLINLGKENIEKLTAELCELSSLFPKEKIGVITGYRERRIFQVCFANNIFYPVLELLYSKREDIISKADRHKSELNINSLNSKFTFLDEDISSPLNSKENFAKVNKILSELAFNTYVLDYKKCNKLRDKVAEEMRSSQADSFTLE